MNNAAVITKVTVMPASKMGPPGDDIAEESPQDKDPPSLADKIEMLKSHLESNVETHMFQWYSILMMMLAMSVGRVRQRKLRSESGDIAGSVRDSYRISERPSFDDQLQVKTQSVYNAVIVLFVKVYPAYLKSSIIRLFLDLS